MEWRNGKDYPKESDFYLCEILRKGDGERSYYYKLVHAYENGPFNGLLENESVERWLDESSLTSDKDMIELLRFVFPTKDYPDEYLQQLLSQFKEHKSKEK